MTLNSNLLINYVPIMTDMLILKGVPFTSVQTLYLSFGSLMHTKSSSFRCWKWDAGRCRNGFMYSQDFYSCFFLNKRFFSRKCLFFSPECVSTGMCALLAQKLVNFSYVSEKLIKYWVSIFNSVSIFVLILMKCLSDESFNNYEKITNL